jgi:hypothetical protein
MKMWRKLAKSSTKSGKIVLEVAGMLGLSYGTSQQILMEDLNMRRIPTKFLSQLLADEQKQWFVFVCQELLDEVRNNQNFLSRTITGDETWLYCYELETKQRSFQGVVFRISLKFMKNRC